MNVFPNNMYAIPDHMYRMGIMAMLINDPTIDRTRCIKMAIVHDLAEATVGDIPPHHPVTKEEKYQLESNAMKDLVKLLGDAPEATEMYDLWLEYEKCETNEAKLVKDFDKFEMIVQAVEYEKREKKRLDTFFESTRGKFRHPMVKAWVEKLYEERAGIQYE